MSDAHRFSPIFDVFRHETSGNQVGLGFYVPPAPNDGGLTVGGLWSATPPRVRQPLQYMGFELFDIDNLDPWRPLKQLSSFKTNRFSSVFHKIQ